MENKSSGKVSNCANKHHALNGRLMFSFFEDTDGFITVSKKKSAKARRKKTNSLNLAVVDIECCLR